MKLTPKEEFELLYPKFKSRELQVPAKPRQQMLFIAGRLLRQPSTHAFPNLLKEQMEQLATLDSNSLAIFFNILVKTLLLEREPTECECRVKFSGFFESFRAARLGVREGYMQVKTESKQIELELKQLALLNCRNSKRSFEVHKDGKIVFEAKFQAEQPFQHACSWLSDAVQSAKAQSVIPLARHPQQQLSFLPLEKKERTPESSVDNSPMLRESSAEEMLMDQKPPGYQVVGQSPEFLLCFKEGTYVYGSVMMTSRASLEAIVNYYIQMHQWNSSIIEQAIHPISSSSNQFTSVKRIKNDSIFSKQWALETAISVNCSKNIATIDQQSLHLQKGKYTLKTRCYRCLGGVKLIIEGQIYGGYWKKIESVPAVVRLFGDLQYFPNSFMISQLQKTSLHCFVKVLAPIHLSVSPKKQSDKEEMSTSDSLGSPTKPQALMLKLRPQCPTDVPGMDYIEMTLKGGEEKCYLGRRFDQSNLQNYDDHNPPYCLSEMLKRGKEYRISNDNQLIYINQGMLRGQKDTLKFVIKQIGANLITGKSVLNVSLPVDIFEPRSLLERSSSSLGMAPDYLIPVADADPLTQIKNVATFIATIPTLELQMQKPFNPILGQTFQAYIKGIPIYYQQISHHPPISAYYMTCPEFTMYGNLIAFADVSLNSAVGGNEGVMHIHMRNGNHFQCYFPPCEISGLIFGNRTFRAYGKGYIFETKSKLFAQMSIEKHKRGLYERGTDKLTPGDMIGGIFKVREEFMERIQKESSLRKYGGLTKKDVESKEADIRGVWFKSISINGEQVSTGKRVYPLQYPQVALPSDSNYRGDILYHKIGNFPESQRMKEVLEVKQRADRKLREKHLKARKKQ